MDHNISVSDFGVRLRPVKITDAGFIVALRNSPHVFGKMGKAAQTVEEQEYWIRNYFNNKDDFYFIVESLTGVPLGTVGIYGINWENASTEYGRLALIKGSFAALPSAILCLDIAFDYLQMKRIEIFVFSNNKHVLSFDKKCGFEVTHTDVGGKIINGEPVDVSYLELTKERWHQYRPKLVELARASESFQIP